MRRVTLRTLSCATCATLLAAGLGCNRSDSDGSADETDDAVVVTGVVSLEAPVDATDVFIQSATLASAPRDLDVQGLSSASGEFTVTLPPGTIDIGSESLVLMTKKTVDGLDLVLWSYATPAPATAVNINVLTSIAYEIGVNEDSLAAMTEADRRTATAFGVTEGLGALDPQEPRLLRLARAVQRAATTLSCKVSLINKAIAHDLGDGDLDGQAADGTSTLLIADGIYAEVLVGLAAVAAGEEPDLAALEAALQTKIAP